MAKRLYVGNLPYEVTQDQLQKLFSEVGTVDEVNLITDRMTGRAKGFAFIDMGSEKEAKEAIKKFDGYELDGRKLVVNEARPREDRSNRGGFGGGNRRSSY